MSYKEKLEKELERLTIEVFDLYKKIPEFTDTVDKAVEREIALARWRAVENKKYAVSNQLTEYLMGIG